MDYMNNIKIWLESIDWRDYSIEVASSDASFRSYYRIYKENKSYILMDSSLDLDSLLPFVDINHRLSQSKVKAPQIIAQNIQKGYLILEDFGDTHYLDILTKDNYQQLYQKAIQEIIKMQQSDISNLSIYNKEFLIFEMNLMQEWYLEKYLNITLSKKEINIINDSIEKIANTVLSQPQDTFVHRDFHSRNILYTPTKDIGIIDFQDAKSGAITYDLVSLLRDCYIEWNTSEVEKLALYYKDQAKLDIDDKTFIRWFDFMGLQRHIKVLGIFSRLYLRDGKDGYLKDIPLTLKYVLDISSKYEELDGLCEILN